MMQYAARCTFKAHVYTCRTPGQPRPTTEPKAHHDILYTALLLKLALTKFRPPMPRRRHRWSCMVQNGNGMQDTTCQDAIPGPYSTRTLEE